MDVTPQAPTPSPIVQTDQHHIVSPPVTVISTDLQGTPQQNLEDSVGVDSVGVDSVEENEPSSPEPLRRSQRYRPQRSDWINPPYSPTGFRNSQNYVLESNHNPGTSTNAQMHIAVDTSSQSAFPPKPQSFEEAMRSAEASKWRRAAEEEYNSLLENNTWSLEDLPPGRTPIEGKWIFRRKLGADGNVDRYKARFVVRGFKQVSGVDYIETELFSPVVRNQSIRFMVALSAKLDMLLEHMDVVTAFLNGDLKETVYIKQPQGFEDPNFPEKFCKLLKALYGLKQSPKTWFEKIDEFLLSIGFKHSLSDPNLYIMNEKDGFAVLALYVDDLVLAATNRKLMDKIKVALIERFKMKNLGDLSYCLRVQVLRDRSAGIIMLHQSKYITEILQRFNLFEAKPLSTPMATDIKLSKEQQPKDQAEMDEMSKVPYK